MNTLKLRHLGSRFDLDSHFFGRAIGAAMRERIESVLATVPTGETLVLDLTGVAAFDYTFADEAVAVLLGRVTKGEYGDRYLVLKADQSESGTMLLENIEVALRLRELAILVSCIPQDQPQQDLPQQWRVIGELPAHLRQTLAVVMEKPFTTVSQVRETMNIDGATATTNRMYKLAALRLVKRRKTVLDVGGSQFIYSGIV